MTHMVNIEGISLAEVLARLFNNSRPVGMGIFAAAHGPRELSVEMAQSIIDEKKEEGGEYLLRLPLRETVEGAPLNRPRAGPPALRSGQRRPGDGGAAH